MFLWNNFEHQNPAIMSADRVSKLLEEIQILNEDHFELVQAVRELILGLHSSVTEEVKYGG